MIIYLNQNDLSLIRGGTEPVKPVSRPKDFYDEEEAKTAAMVANSEEFNWREWLKKWLDKRF